MSLTSPMTIREGCGYEIELGTSCYNPIYGPDAEPRCSSTWLAGFAGPCPSRAISGPTGST